MFLCFFFFFSSRRRHTRSYGDWSSDVCSSDLARGTCRISFVPTGYAAFPKEILHVPRAWAERVYDIRRWTVMSSGGHFAALEEPEALAADIAAFFRPLR